MPSLTTLIALAILVGIDPCGLSRAGAAAAASPFDVLITQRQEQLYYNIPTLPADVLALIQAPFAASDAIAYYKKTNDELIKFNLVLILDQKVIAHQFTIPDNALVCAFFTDCLGHANPWIVTEAVFALGNARLKNALPAIQGCLASPYATVVYHAVEASTRITGMTPDLTPDEVRKVDSVNSLMLTVGNDGLNALSDKELHSYEATPY